MTDITFRPQTAAAIEAVRRGMDLALAQAGRALITPKGGRDIVTSTDIAVEDAIRALISAQCGLPVVGEEQGGEIPPDGSAYWLVDPVCGTRNYATGTRLYSVNVALAEGGQITAAVVGDPSAGEVAVAERGGGAWVMATRPGAGARGAGAPGAGALGAGAPSAAGWRRLRASDASLTVAIEPARAAGRRRAHAAAVTAEIIRADRWDFRSLATTLSLAYVAAGRLSAWAVFWTDSPVHCAAGSLLVTEAGGVVCDLDGGAWGTGSDSCLASANPELQAELLELLAKWRD